MRNNSSNPGHSVQNRSSFVQNLFDKYYTTVMPYLKNILIHATDKPHRMLRAKSMECISLVGMAVGKDKFRADAKEVMDVLIKLQVADMDDDDPTISYMLQVSLWKDRKRGQGGSASKRVCLGYG